MKTVTIIGAGLGGLECGIILQKHGYNVTILEKHNIIGGCFQSFKRKSQLFDTGFHYVGGIGKGEVLHQQLKYFNLHDLSWIQQDSNASEIVVVEDKFYNLPSGLQNYKQVLSDIFPNEANNIARFCNMLHLTGEHIFELLSSNNTEESLFKKFSSLSAYDYIQNNFNDALLKKILIGSSLKLVYSKSTLSLYSYAQITNSYIQSSWKLLGGGQLLINKLAETFLKSGGKIITGAHVNQLLFENGKLTTLLYNNDDYITSDYFISDIDPSITFQCISDSSLKKSIYFRRIDALERSHGFFTLNVILKPNTVPYVSSPIFVHSPDADGWLSSKSCDSLVNFYPSENSRFACAVDIIIPMFWKEVEKWDVENYSFDQSYQQFKEERTNYCINMIDKYLPFLRDNIDSIYSSTPLTYKRYTGAFRGSGFGVIKSFASPLTTIISPKTPFNNLFLTGQNLNLHGLLGVTMTSFNTCSCFINKEELYKEIINS